ncbi:MAG: hypothetical protein ACP5JG_15810 [Anaerolineae bacterium]
MIGPVVDAARMVGDGDLFVCRSHITLSNIGGPPDTVEFVTVTVGLVSDRQVRLRTPGTEAVWRDDEVTLIAKVWHTTPPPLSSYEQIDALEVVERFGGQSLPTQIDEHSSLEIFVDLVGAYPEATPERLSLGYVFEFSRIRPVSVDTAQCSP